MPNCDISQLLVSSAISAEPYCMYFNEEFDTVNDLRLFHNLAGSPLLALSASILLAYLGNLIVVNDVVLPTFNASKLYNVYNCKSFITWPVLPFIFKDVILFEPVTSNEYISLQLETFILVNSLQFVTANDLIDELLTSISVILEQLLIV